MMLLEMMGYSSQLLNRQAPVTAGRACQMMLDHCRQHCALLECQAINSTTPLQQASRSSRVSQAELMPLLSCTVHTVLARLHSLHATPDTLRTCSRLCAAWSRRRPPPSPPGLLHMPSPAHRLPGGAQALPDKQRRACWLLRGGHQQQHPPGTRCCWWHCAVQPPAGQCRGGAMKQTHQFLALHIAMGHHGQRNFPAQEYNNTTSDMLT